MQTWVLVVKFCSACSQRSGTADAEVNAEIPELPKVPSFTLGACEDITAPALTTDTDRNSVVLMSAYTVLSASFLPSPLSASKKLR